VQLVARMAERWYERLSRVLDHQLRGRQPLILYASQAQFQQTNAISGGIGEGTGGVTEGFKRRIVMLDADESADEGGIIRICGHRDLSPDADGDGTVEPREWTKTCPGFDVSTWFGAGMTPDPAHVWSEA